MKSAKKKGFRMIVSQKQNVWSIFSK